MIYIKDDFLPHNLLNAILKDKEKYKEHKTPGKSFWVKEPSLMFIDYISNRISEIEGYKINNILCFFREAKKGQDDKWRIHNDTIIQNQKQERGLEAGQKRKKRNPQQKRRNRKQRKYHENQQRKSLMGVVEKKE